LVVVIGFLVVSACSTFRICALALSGGAWWLSRSPWWRVSNLAGLVDCSSNNPNFGGVFRWGGLVYLRRWCGRRMSRLLGGDGGGVARSMLSLERDLWRLESVIVLLP
jgi:hypothetical protein